MPYITKEERDFLLSGLMEPNNAGQLNFRITQLISEYVKGKGKLNYQLINDVYGALEGAKLEFARRVVNGYEDKKIEENGDVY